jgi:hypothetical protein
VTQKRVPAWLVLPHNGQVVVDAVGAGGGDEGGRGPKLTAGAGGRCRSEPCAAAACTPAGARAVAARGEGAEWGAGGTMPTGGVGGATRGASR